MEILFCVYVFLALLLNFNNSRIGRNYKCEHFPLNFSTMLEITNIDDVSDHLTHCHTKPDPAIAVMSQKGHSHNWHRRKITVI